MWDAGREAVSPSSFTALCPSPGLPENQTLTGMAHPRLPESVTQETQGSQITAATRQRRPEITAARCTWK